MKAIINDEVYGEIVYQESELSGKKNIAINGIEFTKLDKKRFKGIIKEEETIIDINGNIITGVSVSINDKKIQVVPKLTWYEVIMALIPFILVLIWGNSYTLCKIFPVVGGAIGGLISGLGSGVVLVLIRRTKNILIKLLISLVVLIIVFLICAAVGHAIVSTLTK